MSATVYANQLLGLIKTIKNPNFFIYRIFHYLNRFVPRMWASYIYRKNQKEYLREGVSDYLLETYDGGGQAVHPDIAYWKNKYWLTITPYPYGMEEYENPCIYFGESLHSLSVPKSPIAVQHKHTHGVHLSDPCFAIDGDYLYCYYRESERKGNIEENTIWGMCYSETKKEWSEPELLVQSIDDKVLSPALVYKNPGELTVYFVSTLNGRYTLVSSKSKGAITDMTEHHVIGMPDNYDLWHIGISKAKDIIPSETGATELLGLFLVKSKRAKGKMKLFEVRNDGLELDWHVIKEIKMPNAIKDVVAFPYKSCFIPHQNGKILLSFRDKKSRNRMIIIGNN